MLEVKISCHKLTGKFSRNIYVETNDPNHPKETLVCNGRIMEPVTLKPKRISFRQVSRTAPEQKQTVVITPGDAGPLKLKLIPVQSKYFEVELREIETGQHYELEVTLKPPLPAKAVRTTLKLETGLAQSPQITILASATPRPHVVAEPRRFRVPADRKVDWSQAVHLEWDDDAPHRILGATASRPGLKVTVVEKDGQQEVVLEVPEGYEPQPGANAVTITTDDTTAPTVRVSILFSRNVRSPQAGRRRPAARGSIKTNTGKIDSAKAPPQKATSDLAKPAAPPSD